MREATGKDLSAAGSIAQMVCRVDICLVILIIGVKGSGPG